MSAALNWTLGDYLIVNEIDRGQFGTVYEATHPTLGSVALKLIPLQGADSDEKVAAERQGAILQQRFSRANRQLVPEVFEHQPLLGYYAIAMELVHGEPLTSPIARGPLPPRRAAGIALATGAFLEKAHQFKTQIDGVHEVIVHGDLKPAHLLLIPDDSIRVLDFGIAKALAARKSATTNKWGSIDYASPERLESGHVNEHADFWSLGVILFEMAAGYRPYRQYEASPSRLESAIRRQEPRAPLPPGVDAGLAAVINKLLSPQPELRYRSAAAIVGDLTAFMQGAPTVAASESAHASQETIRITAPRAAPTPATSVPTEPLPRLPVVPPPLPGARLTPPPLPPGAGMRPTPTSTAVAAPPASLRRRVRGVVSRSGRMIAAMVIVAIAGLEGLGVARAERLREDAPALEPADVSAARAGFRTIGEWTPLGIGTMRARGPLRDRMVELADRTIMEFRAESPALASAQWEQALDCLELAREVAPGNGRVASKLRYVQGRLAWIRARNRAGVDEAIRLLRDAARLDTSSPDPYLGLATIFAYSTRDLPALTDAILEAEKRGYKPGRRERAELGDLYKVRADRARAAARTLEGNERIDVLQAAAGDYGKCSEYLGGLEFGDSEASVRACRSRLQAVTSELANLTPAEQALPEPPTAHESTEIP